MADVSREAGDGCHGRSVASPAVVPSASVPESGGVKASSRRRTVKPPSTDVDHESIAPLPGADPVKAEINGMEDEVRGKNRELGEAQAEIKALRLSQKLRDGDFEESSGFKKLNDEKSSMSATLQSVHAAQKDNNITPTEASTLEAQLELARQKILKLQDDNKSLDRLTKSKEAALHEAERTAQSALAKASMVDDLKNKNQELMKQIEIFQFPAAAVAGAAGGGGEMLQHHPRQWFPDERDGFISWLRGEFAAANAIIDSLCHHLRTVGEPGEYDGVIGSIQHRRCNWNPVLHMQQYFSISEVMYALQQVTWRRQQRSYDHLKVGGKEFRRSGSGYRQGMRNEIVKEVHNYKSDVNGNFSPVMDRIERGNEKRDVNWEKCSTRADNEKVGAKDAAEPHGDSSLTESGSSESIATGSTEPDGCVSEVREHDSQALGQNEKHNLAIAPRTFVGSEILDGKMVNVVDGLKLYEELFVEKEVLKLISLVNDLRTAGRDGKIQGQTYMVAKRLMKGHGREIIQFGLPILDASLDDDNGAGTSKDRRVEPIPTFLQDVIERIVGMQAITVKPDSCVIDIYNKGDHSQPYIFPASYGKPVSILFLTECDITFGRFISADRLGDYKGTLNLSLAPGSLLVMQGRSADFARRALPSVPKQRISVTFTKTQPKKPAPAEVQRHPPPLMAPWGPPPSRSPNHIRHPTGTKHYPPISSAGVLTAPPPIRPQMAPANGVVQPLFVSAPVAPAMTFPSPVQISPVPTAWAPAAPRHPPPRILGPGTGVFLPPGSGNSASLPLLSTSTSEVSFAAETSTLQGKENGHANANHCISPKEKSDTKPHGQDCNGNVDGVAGGRSMAKEEQHQESNEGEKADS